MNRLLIHAELPVVEFTQLLDGLSAKDRGHCSLKQSTSSPAKDQNRSTQLTDVAGALTRGPATSDVYGSNRETSVEQHQNATLSLLRG